MLLILVQSAIYVFHFNSCLYTLVNKNSLCHWCPILIDFSSLRAFRAQPCCCDFNHITSRKLSSFCVCDMASPTIQNNVSIYVNGEKHAINYAHRCPLGLTSRHMELDLQQTSQQCALCVYCALPTEPFASLSIYLLHNS